MPPMPSALQVSAHKKKAVIRNIVKTKYAVYEKKYA
jgi:hypothetical protein